MTEPITTIVQLPDVSDFAQEFRALAKQGAERFALRMPPDMTVATVVAVVAAAKREGYENTMFLAVRAEGALQLGFEREAT
jgi:biopolymer transport protein ExbD